MLNLVLVPDPYQDLGRLGCQMACPLLSVCSLFLDDRADHELRLCHRWPFHSDS